MTASRLAGLTGATLETVPSVCHGCVWWQSRGNREPEKRKWKVATLIFTSDGKFEIKYDYTK